MPVKARSILAEKKDAVGKITLSKPDKLNAIDAQMLREMGRALDRLEADAEVRVVILTGSGKAFSVGADVAELASRSPESAAEFALRGRSLFSRIENLKKPVIAAVNGFALGGGNELAMACDIRIASESAVFGQPEVGLGITPGWGATQRLPHLVGLAGAKELIFTGKLINATEAARIGLVSRVVPPERLVEEAESVAKTIARQSAAAVELAKKALNGLISEAEAFRACFSSPDPQERMKAFLEKQERRHSQAGRS